MGCGIAMVKYLLFIFNFIFALLGIAILAISVWVLLASDNFNNITDALDAPVIIFIVLGVIIFVIAFFGCCGAIRESHCMVVTFAVLLLTILVIQVGIGIWAFVVSKSFTSDDSIADIKKGYRDDIFVNYWSNDTSREVVDAIQSNVKCCGVDSFTDFTTTFNTTIPWSCCGNEKSTACTVPADIYKTGCVDGIVGYLEKYGYIVGGVAIGIAVTELIGIIFALCLANSIRNDDRRGYRV